LYRNYIDASDIEINQAFKRLDTDRDAKISFNELKRFFNNYVLDVSTTSPYSYSKTLGNFNSTIRYSSPLRSRTYYSPVRSVSPRRYDSPLRKTLTILNKSNNFSSTNSVSMERTGSPLRGRTGFNSNGFESPYKSTRLSSPLRNQKTSPIRNNDSLLSSSTNRINSPLRRTVGSGNFGETYTSSSSLNKVNMLSYEEEAFLGYLRDVIEYESELERIKNELSLKSDFNMEDAFCIFELDGRGYISDLDLKYGLNNYLEVFPSIDELAILMKRYDTSKSGVLRYFTSP